MASRQILSMHLFSALTFIGLFFFFSHVLPASCAAHHQLHLRYPQRRLSSIRVRGTALCDSCHQNRLSTFFSLPISGATITLACKNRNVTTRTTSDQQGAFAFDLPFSKPRNLRRCKVQLTSSPFEGCNQHTRSSIKMLSPILRLHPDADDMLTYSCGWLSFQPKSIPRFCNLSDPFGLKDGHSNNTSLLPQGYSFPWFPPLPGSSTPSFPFNFYPPSFPVPNFPGTATPGNPFSSPSIPGFPPFPGSPSFPNFPWLPPFPSFPFLPFPGFPPFSTPASLPSFPPFDLWSPPSSSWEFPPLPPNPFPPTTTTFPNLPPPSFQIPSFPPNSPLFLFNPPSSPLPFPPISLSNPPPDHPSLSNFPPIPSFLPLPPSDQVPSLPPPSNPP